MDQSIVIKYQIKPKSHTDEKSLAQAMEQFRLACNYISQYIFEHDFERSQTKLNNKLYHPIRDKFGLKAQMAQSAIRCTVARYKTVKTQLARHPFCYDTGKKDENGKPIWKSIPRDLNWLGKPVFFHRPQLDLQRGRDWSYQKDNQISLNTLQKKRIIADLIEPKGFKQYLDGTWKLGLAKVLKVGQKWYLHISATKTFSDYQKGQSQHVVGIDRGLHFLTTSYDEKGQTAFYSGKKVMQIRRKYKRLRAQLQSKGTKSAKRKLKKIGQRENRWMTDVNHQLSKTLVDKYGSNTLFVLEDLTGVRFATEQHDKDYRYEDVSWAFYQLEQFLTYKAHLNHSEVVKVAANYTSQRCPKCGRINKANRDHHKHLYTCDKCGYSTNDDRIGAINIQLLGTRYISGNDQPRFVKTTGSE
ncbi:RNA-guided endonuclease TnpB family protein [Lactobacillus crispatus]|uniref:RNA-guided endonuclease TnpB family protein n=1 Tax=Lactobacillus crispatus TaxID=47770 RepID=UPI001431B04E|nr:RNA-guided endonuclease TnpB family protein [Lactobacillus crispatus]NJJ54323.1 IS200/IS605 family element transposase accessory protein TnpB [Lactobacillus crispatus]